MTRIIVLLVIFWQPVYELKLDPLQLPMPRSGFDIPLPTGYFVIASLDHRSPCGRDAQFAGWHTDPSPALPNSSNWRGSRPFDRLTHRGMLP